MKQIYGKIMTLQIVKQENKKRVLWAIFWSFSLLFFVR